MSDQTRSAAPSYDDLVGVLVKAKCIRWTMGTCVSRDVPEAEWCSVCETLNRLGYEPVEQDGTSVETWRLVEVESDV